MKIRKYTNWDFYKIIPEKDMTLTFWQNGDDILDFYHSDIIYQASNTIPANLREITAAEASELDRQREEKENN